MNIGIYTKCLLISLLLGAVNVFGQKSDSLKLLQEIFPITLAENPEKSILIANQILQIARQLNNKEAEGEALYHIGQGNYFMGRKKEAIHYYKQSENILASSANSNLLGRVYNAVGNCYVEVEDYATGLLFYKRALTLFTQVGERVKTYNNIGSVNIFLKRYDSAEFYFEKSLQLSNNDPRQKLVYLNNVAYIHYETGDYKNAIEQYRESIRYAETLKEERYLPRFYKNLADCYLRDGQYDSCSSYLNKSLTLSRQAKRYAQEADALLSYASYYDSLNQITQAIEMAEQARSVMAKTSAYSQGKVFAQLSHLYHQAGNLSKALEYEKRNTRYLDSVRLINQRQAIAFSSEQSFQQKGKPYWMWLLAVLVLLVTIVGFFLFRQNRKSEKTTTPETSEILQDGKYIKGQNQGGETLLLLDDIIWFEKIDRSYYAFLANDKYRVRPTIAELETTLSATFVRINRSVIINLAFLLNYSPWENNKYVVRLKQPEGTEFISTRDRIRKIEEQKTRL